MEVEITALAHSCRELFPVMDIVTFLGHEVGLPVGDPTMNVSIHEDNAGALVVAIILPHHLLHIVNIMQLKPYGL